MCRDERSLSSGYCCDPGETSRACVSRDFCSNQAQTISMQMTACPFNSKTCAGTTSNIVLRGINNTQTLLLNSTSNRLFNSTAICYYTVTAEGVTETNRTIISVEVNKYQNVYVHLNNGTTRKTASNPVEVNPLNTGTKFSYNATNNTVYLIIVGNNDNPLVNISLSLKLI